jgi:AraC family transcriptional regulator, regulatory protein of adaptative response / methylated-DNA-[protein]-cysteine methyltransferase
MNAIINRPDGPIEEIRFALGPFSLGTALVAFSDKGVAAILMGSDRDALIGELVGIFPHTHLIADEAGLEDVLAQVVAFLEAPQKGLDLPLDIRGSAQKQAIWRALRNVPSGQTVTYGQMAKALPLPATAQEVGAACAANVLAVAIPCHRVLKADGSIAGYRWGVRRKRALLLGEAAA